MKNHIKYPLIAVAAVFVLGACYTILPFKSLLPDSSETGLATPMMETIESSIIHAVEVPLASEPTEAAETDPFVQKVVDLVNEERTNAGVGTLVMSSELNQAAAIRAEELYQKFAHERPDGSKYSTVLDEFDFTYSGCGENVAYGYTSPEHVMEGWMNSEGHKTNILHPPYTMIGAGYYKASNGYYYWAQMMAY